MNVALHPEQLNIISLCTGGYGLDHAVELAVPGARTVCMVEREAFAVAQLVSAMEAGLVAPAPVWSDARTFKGRPWRGLVDGIIGGIPCQPHSLAGKRLGEEDERDLWSTARRIIVQSGAWFVLIENVRGMLSSGGAERVWRDLHRLGFQVEGGLFTAAEVGATHERERLFILAVADRRGDGQQWCSELHGHTIEPGQQAPRRDHAERRDYHVAGVGLADAFGKGLEGLQSGRVTRPGEQGPASQRDGRTVGDTNPGASEKPEGNEAVRAGRPEQPTRNRAAGRNARLFPPGPDDVAGWRDTLSIAPELEPAFRRVADGLAPVLDTARVDRLRMLGNGVVPLEGAYAVRTLAARLAARGSPAAARLVWMMEGIEA